MSLKCALKDGGTAENSVAKSGNSGADTAKTATRAGNTGKKYNTRQRDVVAALFCQSRGSCLTAREVIERLSVGDEPIGEATIYRCLARLTDEGVLRRFVADKGDAASYQYNGCDEQHEHFHLKCVKCGRIIHMDCGFMSEMSGHIRDSHDFVVDNGKTVLYGLCGDCRR